MASLKSLAKDTAIYGLSSIVGRFLNYLLVPLYTHCLPSTSGDYGISTNMYALVALMFVVLTFGMETTMFRYANGDATRWIKGNETEFPKMVFSTAFAFIAVLVTLFLAVLTLCIDPISVWLGYREHPEYLMMMGVVLALDSLQALPFSYLRFQKRAVRFASLKLLFIALNIGLNCIYFLWLGKTSVFYIFFINLLSTAFITLFFVPDMWSNFSVRLINGKLLRSMLSYSWPLLILGVAGILNQTFDKIAFIMVGGTAEQLGIYGACVKIAMIMAMITQAFRYAYEPMVFAASKDKDAKVMYAFGMKYFIIFTLLAFLCVIGYMDILQYLIGADYREGLRVVPIVMVAEIMMGVYFNLSFWYKLIDKTIYGAWFSLAGCATLIAVNLIFIPHYSYMACAWGGVAGYGTSMVLSYVVGQRKNPIDYPMSSIFVYVAMTALFYAAMSFEPETWSVVLRLGVNTLLILLFCAYIFIFEIKKKRK